jgi:hypothetical protein
MADKIRIIEKDAKSFGHNAEYYSEFDTFLFDLDKFYRDYRKEISKSVCEGTVILPSEYFKKWIELNKE